MSTTVLKTLQMCFKPVWNNSSVPRGILLKQSMTTSVFVLNEGGGGGSEHAGVVTGFFAMFTVFFIK